MPTTAWSGRGSSTSHTHLDKGHIAPRRGNPDGSFMGALNAVLARTARRTGRRRTSRQRMDFSLRCALRTARCAIRTHLDSRYDADEASHGPSSREMREAWTGRIALQATPLFSIDLALDDRPYGRYQRRWWARYGHTLGAVTFR